MVLLTGDKISVKSIRQKRHWTRKLIAEFPNKIWTFVTPTIKVTGSVERGKIMGQMSIRENIESVQELLVSQEISWYRLISG